MTAQEHKRLAAGIYPEEHGRRGIHANFGTNPANGPKDYPVYQKYTICITLIFITSGFKQNKTKLVTINKF